MGFINCRPNCTYTVCFDNTYSYFKNKKIQYSVLMTQSIELEEDEENAEDLTALKTLEIIDAENVVVNRE